MPPRKTIRAERLHSPPPQKLVFWICRSLRNPESRTYTPASRLLAPLAILYYTSKQRQTLLYN